MIRDKRSLGLIILIIIIFLILSIRLYFLVTPNNLEENINEDKSPIFKQGYSIYNGTDPEIIAERFAEALNESPIKSKNVKNCCGGTIWRFELQNDNHFSIETRKLKNNNSILIDMSSAQSAYHEDNLSFNAEYAKKIVLNFAERFLKVFDVELGDNYNISVYSWHHNRSWQVDIYQIFNDKFINRSGFHAIVDRENGEIRTMDFGDWLDPEIIVEEKITLDDGKMIIYNELKENNFNITVPYFDEFYDEENDFVIHCQFNKYHTIPINISDIKFIEYRVLWGRLCYKYEINYQINATKTCTYEYIIDSENGKKLHWGCYSEMAGSGKSYYNNLI